MCFIFFFKIEFKSQLIIITTTRLWTWLHGSRIFDFILLIDWLIHLIFEFVNKKKKKKKKTKEGRTLSACLRQSMRLILPFWSGLDRTHMAGFLPVMLSTKSSRHSCVMSLRSLPSRRLAHFCFTSGFSFYKTQNISWFRNIYIYLDLNCINSISCFLFSPLILKKEKKIKNYKQVNKCCMCVFLPPLKFPFSLSLSLFYIAVWWFYDDGRRWCNKTTRNMFPGVFLFSSSSS